MARPQQREFGFTNWGGKRRGAGRKPDRTLSRVSHSMRERVTRHTPVHLTLRFVDGLPNMRTRERHRCVVDCLIRASRETFRVVEYVLLSNHMHLIVESASERALSDGMQALCVRIARAVNRALRRRGPVFADRYHVHVLRTPRETNHAVAYVRRNAAKHGVMRIDERDHYSSAGATRPWCASPALLPSRSWLLDRPVRGQPRGVERS